MKDTNPYFCRELECVLEELERAWEERKKAIEMQLAEGEGCVFGKLVDRSFARSLDRAKGRFSR